MKNDALGDRMKEFYEDRTRIKLPRRTYTIIRIDGKAFHTYTKGLQRPFDDGLIEDMNATTAYLCKNIQGAKFGYVQSDEISLVLTDFDDLGTHAWFDNNLQKMVSVAASMATNKFNELRTRRFMEVQLNMGLNEQTKENILGWFKRDHGAEFDARAFQIPFIDEVENYFIWRQQDAVRNSISSVAQSLYSTKELHGVKTDGMQELIFQKGINWNDYDFRKKRGAVIRKVETTSIRTMQGPNEEVIETEFTRNKWQVVETPTFTQDRFFIRGILNPSKNIDVEQFPAPYSPKLGDLVYYPVDAASFKVVGLRENEIEIEGDWSGGTHNVCQKGWVKTTEVKLYDETKVTKYDRQGKVITKL
ncbi:MAG: tRNA(His) guanylyltransferase Thg1 family protein [Dolichospermum sp.]